MFCFVSFCFFVKLAEECDPWFSIKIHHGGYFTNLPWKAYVGGYVDHFDLVHMEKVCMVDIDEMVEECGYSGFMNYYWRVVGADEVNLEGKLKDLKSDRDVMDMVNAHLPQQHKISMYVVALTREEMIEQEKAYVEHIKSSLTLPKARLVELDSEDVPEEQSNISFRRVRGQNNGKAKLSVGGTRLSLPSCSVGFEGRDEAVVDGVGDVGDNSEYGREEDDLGTSQGVQSEQVEERVGSVRGSDDVSTVGPEIVAGEIEDDGQGISGAELDISEREDEGDEDEESEDVDYEGEEGEEDSESCTSEFYETDNEIGQEDEGMNIRVGIDPSICNMQMRGGSNGPEENRASEQGTSRSDGHGGQANRCMGYTFEERSSDYSSSDDGPGSVHENSEDELESVPLFNPETDMKDPKFELRMVFPSFDILRKAVKQYSIRNRVGVEFAYNDKRRLRVVCQPGCPFLLTAGKYKDGPQVQIKRVDHDHSCARVVKNKWATFEWIADEYLEVIKSHPGIPLAALVDHIRRDFNIRIHRSKAQRGKKLALRRIRGDEEEQYAKLPDYGGELRKTNPGSVLMLGLDNCIFQRVFICISGAINGFLAGCRPIISIDGCFLKGVYGGQLLSAVGIDSNDCIWPIAYAVVESESRESWGWFLFLLSNALGISETHKWTIMSDRQKVNYILFVASFF